MKNLSITNQRKIVTAFKIKPGLKSVFVNKYGEFQFAKVDGFDTEIKREDVEGIVLPDEVIEVKEINVEANAEVLQPIIDENNLLKEKLNAAGLDNETLKTLNDAYEKEIGELIEGETEDDRHPRAESWLQERRNFITQLETLEAVLNDNSLEIERLKKSLEEAEAALKTKKGK